MSARITVQVAYCDDSNLAAWARGTGAGHAQLVVRDMLAELRGRSPLFSGRLRAWCTTPQTAADLEALAESRGFRVERVQELELAWAAGNESEELRTDAAHAKGVLW